ncbi:amino acid permease-associated region [Novosphingobium nitrogenifigens DSM 19370]|uniref:Amino acid permease-associated region n=1 Tax=Novosphingobium nitrogenifigens DSM 19370 TaxID=983920 RepID=F1ZAY5_9SPHN|nr:amino acid permease [Novosphingobium nitrogenifigens]EGD58237.1 amino acid permease-associated region [Novosphingobium nitrogenifigens DSM 19370]
MTETTADDDAELRALGYSAQFDRNMSLWENFALGFTYLSPVVGVYSLFATAIASGGPPMIWWYGIAAIGQMIVCLTFCEVVSQFPIAGGLYPWCRRLVGKKWAWMAGWVYGWALFTSIAGVSAGAAPFVAQLFGFEATPVNSGLISIALVAISTLTNLAGTKTLARVAMFGFICEILGALVVGAILLLFHRHQPVSVILDPHGVSHGGPYFPAFMSAAIVGLFTCYGFEACGDVAEETPNPGVAIPKAMKSTIYIGMSASIFVCLALILSLPDIGAVIDGRSTTPIQDALMAAFGPIGTKAVIVVVLVSFLSCVLSLQAAASRLAYAYARDDMVVASTWLRKVSTTHHVPTNALALSGVIAAAILVLGMFFANAVATIVSFAVVGIYAGFQMVVMAALFARAKGWRPHGKFRLGGWGWPINIVGLVWGVSAIADMLQPGGGDLPWYESWGMVMTFVAVVVSGLVYMVIGRPYDRSDSPAGDAWRPRSAG